MKRFQTTLLVAFAAGCAATNTVEPTSPTSVEVVAEGGIAALSIRDRVDRDSRAWVHVTRHLCADTCTAPTDSASGVLPGPTVDSLFNGVLAQKIQFKDDYGTTHGAADMMDYTVRITSNGSTKTIRADDGTMPDALRQIIVAVREATAGARK